ncbi:hypothetical protein predicted by Glimmer/Critica [Sorangium cellulosum So ce56]|uniref:Uncharacterized protein n=2 Tax=Polyangiaceae TaxID=49 RepID=A9FXP5_SORC5|nr:hypothetical protein predicted by Glimmer/Critica [Sorangium cellulosum So ce56]
MNRGSPSRRLSRSRVGSSLSVLLCVPVVALALAGCGGTEPSSSSESDESAPDRDETMSWEEFQANVYRDPQRGVYLIDDEQGLNDAELRVVYERYVKTGALVVKPLGRR